MRIYFLSAVKVALKLNGEYVGVCDLFDRYCDVDVNSGVFAEVIPEGNYFCENFFIDQNFLNSPPDFIDLFFFRDEAAVYVKKLKNRSGIKILSQTKFCKNLITVFEQDGVKVLCGEDGNNVFELAPEFSNCKITESAVGGFPVLLLTTNERLAIISENGKVVFYNQVNDFKIGEKLTVKKPFESCTGAYAQCEFAYDGCKFLLEKSVTEESFPPDNEILHFAFFESVLYCGNFSKYLSDELAEKAEFLKDYLGDFCDVAVPSESFFKTRKIKRAVGLVYPESKNKFFVKYYSVEVDNGKICNIFPVE